MERLRSRRPTTVLAPKRRCAASASLLGRPIDTELTRRALHKLHPVDPAQLELEVGAVVRAVAAFFGTTPEALAARSRRGDVLLPRQLAMYFCREYTTAPLAEIARAFGRDHPSVANAVRQIERGILERAPLRYQVEELAARFNSERIALAIASALATAALGWLDARQRIGATQEELARRLRDIEADARDARSYARQAQEAMREAQAKLGALEGKLADALAPDV